MNELPPNFRQTQERRMIMLNALNIYHMRLLGFAKCCSDNELEQRDYFRAKAANVQEMINDIDSKIDNSIDKQYKLLHYDYTT